MKFIKIWGLQHTFTNYLELVLEHNFENILILVNQFGWKHGKVRDDIDNKYSLWYEKTTPEYTKKLLLKNDLEIINKYKNELKNKNKIINLIAIKDIYDWYYSTKIKRCEHWTEDTPQIIGKWNSACLNYYKFYKKHQNNTMLISYYSIRNSFEKIINNITDKFDLISKNNSYMNFSLHYGNEKKEVGFKNTIIYDYKKKSNNFIKDKNVIIDINKYVNKKMIKKYLELSRI